MAQTYVPAERRIETGTAVHDPTLVFAHSVKERVHDLGVDIERRQCSAEVADALWPIKLVERD